MLWQNPLPSRYTAMSEEELATAIAARKGQLGPDLIILGHHYQQDEVIRFADFTGDSFKLSQLAAERVRESSAQHVVFAGVHFMAESADILTPDEVAVILPDLGAGCSMADMASHDDTLEAWEQITSHLETSGFRGRVIPICYMNCSASIKAFCGQHEGAVCTSSNCQQVFKWALEGGMRRLNTGEQIKILFLPDQHLGRNTAAALGFDIHTDMCLWDPQDSNIQKLGGCKELDIDRSSFILWKGHCSVHKLFRPEHVDQIRAKWPDVNVIVHPECGYEVCQKADQIGSTESIRLAIESADSGSRWAVGTEVHMVNRLARESTKRGVKVRILSDCQCLCTTMYRINMPHLLYVLDQLSEGKVVNRIRVPDEDRRHALAALDRMLTITSQGSQTSGSPIPIN